MTRLPSQGQADLLRLLAQMPFLDRLEMAALAGRSRGGVYQAADRLEEAGLAASVPHGTPLLAPTRRYYLTEQGVNALAWRRSGPWASCSGNIPSPCAGAGRCWNAWTPPPSSTAWPQSWPAWAIPWTSAGAGPCPRTPTCPCPTGACWPSFARVHRRARRFRQAPLAAGPGSPAERRPGDRPRRGAPAPGRRPAARGPYSGVPGPGLLRVGAPRRGGRGRRSIWRSSAGAALSLEEAVGRANPGGMTAAEPPLVRVSVPKGHRPARQRRGRRNPRPPAARPAAPRREARPGPAGRLALAHPGGPGRAPGRQQAEGIPAHRRPGTPGTGNRLST